MSSSPDRLLSNRVLVGDVLTGLAQLPDGCVQTCVTSPPYYGLRDYGMAGQIGLEKSPDEFIARLVAVFREVRRVLRDDGTLWLNIGDSYAGGGTIGRNDTTPEALARRAGRYGTGTGTGSAVGSHGQRKAVSGLKPKDLIGIPWMLAFALRADGWFLRQDIIWHKPNPMPESVTDRCTKAHEYVFLLSKSARYFYDFDAMQEPVCASTVERLSQPTLATQVGSARVPGKTNGNMKAVGQSDTRNRRSVWTVSTQPFREAHFATFPEELVEPCILAGSKVGDLVLDPFLGSGTTAAVAQRLGRDYVGCELNPAYAVIARNRISNTQPGLALA